MGKVQENQGVVELNGRHQLLFYDDDINIMYENINTKKWGNTSSIRS
jgi:hypothetical protein